MYLPIFGTDLSHCTVPDEWFRPSETLQGSNEVRCGDHMYLVASFRSSPILKIRSDGMCTVIYVGFSFPSVAAIGGHVVITEQAKVLEYDPDALTLTAQSDGPRMS